jgi:hypothetical protein
VVLHSVRTQWRQCLTRQWLIVPLKHSSVGSWKNNFSFYGSPSLDKIFDWFISRFLESNSRHVQILFTKVYLIKEQISMS